MSAPKMRAAALPLLATLWPSRAHPFGRRVVLTWARFLERFVADPEPSIKKEAVAGFALATFTGDHRALEHVELAYALTLDFDRGRTSMGQAAKLFPGTRGCVYTSYSSVPTYPKLRLVMPLRRPVTADEYSRLWVWAEARCRKRGHPIDLKACDASRLWYIPSHPFGCTTYAWRELRGRPLDAESLLKRLSPVLPGHRSISSARSAPPHRKDGGAAASETLLAASETLLGRVFTAAGLALNTPGPGKMYVTCPWERLHTGPGDVSSTVVFPSTSAAARGHFHCLHQHCMRRTASDVLRTLPARAVAHARREHGLETQVKVTVVGATFDVRPAWDARPPLVRWRLDLATRDGELLHGNVMLPSHGYEDARAAYDAVFPGLRWTSKLESFSEWKRRKIVPMGLKLAVTLRGSEVTSMRAAGGARRRQPRPSETARARRSA
jgi:hypothetical protein